VPRTVLSVCWLLSSIAAAAALLSPDGQTVYDSGNKITWLADSNLPASNRFTLPLCIAGVQPCVNANGSMNYASAAAWVAAMNAANYLGHSNWQLPTSPSVDRGCSKTGSNGNSFGYGCSAGALGSLYYTTLGLKAPATAVPIPANSAGPFSNLQPYLYWSGTNAGSNGNNTFSFDTGWQGANTPTHLIYVWPMIPGRLAGMPASTGQGLQVNPDGQTVYDPVSNVTWLANANIAATNPFGLPACQTATTPVLCVGTDGAMNLDSANQFIANMNTAKYLGQTTWQLPAIDPACSGYDCGSAKGPMGELYYGQFGLTKGMSAVSTPNLAVGPFHNFQPYLYWTCLGATVTEPCQSDTPVNNQEFSFSFGNGFEGTDVLANDLFVTAYFVGTAAVVSGPEISEVANAEGENPAIAPNTWVEIKGVNLAPAGDSRIWQAADFSGDQMPTQLDQVSVSVNGKSAFVYYISPTQVNVLTAPDAISGPVQVQVTNNGAAGGTFAAQVSALSPSFFVINGGPYVAAVHADGSLIAPGGLYAGATPARPGETVLLYANGMGPTTVPVVNGSRTQTGVLPSMPAVKIGGLPAVVQYSGLVAAGEFQFNVVIPSGLADGDQPLTAAYQGASTQAGTLIAIHK